MEEKIEGELFDDFSENIESYIEELIVEADKFGFTFEQAELHYDFNYSQGRGASFDGYISITEFLNGNSEVPINLETREVLLELIEQGYVEDIVHISKNQFANHYSHEKTRFVDYVEIIVEYDDYEFTDETVESNIHKLLYENKLKEILENKRLELCSNFISKVDAYLTERAKKLVSE